MGEIVTKIALIVFGISIYKSGYLSSQNAIILTGALLILNFLRDLNLRHRQAIRMFPGYGMWFFLAFSIIVPTNAFLKHLIGYESWGFTHWESVFASGVLSMIFRAYMIVCESISRWTVYSLGWDNRRVDYAMDYMWRTGFLSKYFYWNPDYLNDNNCNAQDYSEDYDDENYDDIFYGNSSNEVQGYVEYERPKCITCCPVQPKR